VYADQERSRRKEVVGFFVFRDDIIGSSSNDYRLRNERYNLVHNQCSAILQGVQPKPVGYSGQISPA
jgi:hypothetical protein